MEPWNDLLSTLEHDEIENIYLAVCDQRLSYPYQPLYPPSNPERHDSGISGVSADEDDIKLPRRSDNISPAQQSSTVVCSQPTQEDFDNAAWISTKQNGMTQYWAPRYTAAPHNNTPNSARLWYTSSLKTTAIAQSTRKGCTAVDLSAGSGAVAFGYAAAGVQKVLCWDANPWSIEGLRRGAVKNRWPVQVYHDQIRSRTVKVSSKTRVMAFVEDGDKASGRINCLRNSLPPVRHVNCGLLPTSRNLHATAAAILDPKLGGWIHIQETYRTEEVVCGANKTRAELEAIVQTLDRERGYLSDVKGIPRRPVVQHIQRVGWDAPGVFFCVVDIHIPPIRI